MWFKVGKEEVNITPGNLLILEKAMENMSYSCTCTNCSVKRLPTHTNNPKCYAFYISLKQYLESKISSNKKTTFENSKTKVSKPKTLQKG